MKKGKKPTRRCEFCNVAIRGRRQDTSCLPCEALIDKEEAKIAARAAAHAAKFKCQLCAAPLPLHKARHCDACMDASAWGIKSDQYDLTIPGVQYNMIRPSNMKTGRPE